MRRECRLTVAKHIVLVMVLSVRAVNVVVANLVIVQVQDAAHVRGRPAAGRGVPAAGRGGPAARRGGPAARKGPVTPWGGEGQ